MALLPHCRLLSLISVVVILPSQKLRFFDCDGSARDGRKYSHGKDDDAAAFDKLQDPQSA
jgi:hypothetical protein